MKVCIDKKSGESTNLFGLYISLKARNENILNENYKRIIGSDTVTEQILIDAKKNSDFDKINMATGDYRNKLLELAIWRDKKWENGRTLKVKFLEGSDFVKQKVREKAMVWTRFANLDFNFIEDGDADIRISFQQGKGSWSYVGLDNLSIDTQTEPTMNFGWFNNQTTDFEFSRTTLHEFGHAIGCIHEHQSPAANIPWDKPAVYRYYAASQGWTKEDVDNNIFAVYDNSTISNSNFDKNSIMLYPIDGSLTGNRYSVGMNYLLSQNDISYIRAWYPGK